MSVMSYVNGPVRGAVLPELAGDGAPWPVPGRKDRRLHAHQILREAEREAQALVEAARQKAAALTEEAYREGKLQGRGEALAEAREHCQAGAAALEAAARRLRSLDEEFRTKAGEAIVSLALAVAEHVCRREIRQDPALILSTIREALTLLPGLEEIVVRLHPEQFALIQEHRNELLGTQDAMRALRLVADPRIEPDGCLVETPGCLVDASLPAQLEEARRRLRGDPR